MALSIDVRPDLTVLRFETSRLDHWTTRDLSPVELDLTSRRVGLDLRSVGWVHPFGLVYLFWYIRALLRHGATQVDIALPDDPNISNYLARMRLPDPFESDDRISFHNVPRVRERGTFPAVSSSSRASTWTTTTRWRNRPVASWRSS